MVVDNFTPTYVFQLEIQIKLEFNVQPINNRKYVYKNHIPTAII